MRKTEIRILQIFLGGISLLFGGFYEYTSYLSGIFLCLFLLWLWKRRGQLSFCFNITGIALAVLCLGYGLAVFWGVDRGMSFLGFLKVIPLLLFLLTAMQFTVQEKAEILKAVPWTGLLILGISMGAFVTGIGKSVFFLSGRLGGSFQYSNTMALYFLLGMVILFYLEKKRGRYRFFVFCLYMGILFTGSRSVFFSWSPVACLYRHKGEETPVVPSAAPGAVRRSRNPLRFFYRRLSEYWQISDFFPSFQYLSGKNPLLE